MTARRILDAPFHQFVSRALIFLFLAAVIAVFLFFLWWARHLLFLAFTGVLLGILITALADGLHRITRIPHGGSVAIAVLAVLVAIGLVGWLVGAAISQQIGQLVQQLPDSVEQLRSDFEKTAFGKAVGHEVPLNGKSLMNHELLSNVAAVFGGAIDSLIDAIVVIFVGLYAAAQPDWYRRGLLHLVPQAKRNRAEQVLNEIAYELRWWFVGQLLSMVIIGIMVGVGLWLIGMPLPLALGMLAFLLEIVPYVGPFIAFLPAILIAGVQGPQMALWVLLIFTVVHVVEGYVVMPLVQVRRTIHLPPAINILAAILFAWLGGVLGVLDAAPIVLTLMVLVRMLYVEDVLQDWSAAPTDTKRPRGPSPDGIDSRR